MQDTDTATRPDVLRKFGKRHGPNHEPEVEHGMNSMTESRPAIQAPMFDVVLGPGSIRSFNYAYLKEIEFNAGDVIKIKFTDGTLITVEGCNLDHDRHQLRLHRATEIRQGTPTERERKPEGAAHIDRITITKGEEDL